MSYRRRSNGHYEVQYATAADMLPQAQQDLLKALEQELATRTISVLFLVDTLTVPRSVPEFWLDVTKRMTPSALCDRDRLEEPGGAHVDDGV